MEDNMQRKIISSVCSFRATFIWNLSQLRGLTHMHKCTGWIWDRAGKWPWVLGSSKYVRNLRRLKWKKSHRGWEQLTDPELVYRRPCSHLSGPVKICFSCKESNKKKNKNKNKKKADKWDATRLIPPGGQRLFFLHCVFFFFFSLTASCLKTSNVLHCRSDFTALILCVR